MPSDTIRITVPGRQEQQRVAFCQEHWSRLVFAMLDRGLGPHIAGDPDELAMKLRSGEMDAGMEAGTALTTTAINTLGIETVLEHDGCPICAFDHITELIADRMAMKYLEPH